MAERTLPGIGLTAFWDLGADGWNTGMDTNLRLLSALVQPRALDHVGTTPGSPTNGDIYLFTAAHATQPNKVAIYDNGAWVYVTPASGWIVYDVAAGYHRKFNGTAWVQLISITSEYRMGFFFTTAPSASEVLAIHPVTTAFTFPANFASPTSKGGVGTNPAGSFVLDVQRQVGGSGAFSSIGTITISTGGSITFATASGTSKSIAAGDVIKVVGPSSADASIADVAITLVGSI